MMLAIPCGVFHDVFSMFQPASLAADGYEAASQLLTCWGGGM